MYVSDLRHDNPTLADKLQSLYHLNRNHGLDLSFRPAYLNLLQAFSNPHLHLPPTIHIAGTNGKGSTLAILRSALEAKGLRVHVYTSPHLVQFNERIVLAGQMITDTALEALVDEALAYNGDTDISFFEITTAIAFAAFARTPADIVLLETGLGGRLDCTNVIEQPLATIITPIGMDHQDYLGETITDIAAEKAGIMKRGCPTLIGKQTNDQALSTLVRHAHDLDCPITTHAQDWTCEAIDSNTIRFTWQDQPAITLPRPSLIGTHQIDNAGLALATLHRLQDHFAPIDTDVLNTAMRSVTWPARLQNITSAFPDLALQNWSLWLDGGHNADAAAMLCDQIQNWQHTTPDTQVHVICAMMGHKDAKAFLTPLSQLAASITFVPLAHEPAANAPKDLQKLLPDTPSTIATDVTTAMHALTSAHTGGQILICGSLYLAGEVLQTIAAQA